MQSRINKGEVIVKLDLSARNAAKQTLLRVRVPDGWPVISAKAGSRELRSPSTNLRFEISDLKSLKPVEFKLGKRRQFENDDVQLCAQALCLEEMFNVSIPRGAVFHGDSKRRREVEFTAELRARTEQAVAEVRTLLPQSEISHLRFEIPKLPPARYIEGRCEECSLYEICLPKATAEDSRATRLGRQLFQI